MRYELAKELKDAGFPHEGSWYSYDGNSYSGKRTIYIPTLEELIEACGVQFYALFFMNRDTDNYSAEDSGGDHHYGSTPKEAVARLWLALQSPRPPADRG